MHGRIDLVSNLVTRDLSNNLLTRVTSTAFSGMSKMITLLGCNCTWLWVHTRRKLDSNEVTLIETNSFSMMTALTSLFAISSRNFTISNTTRTLNSNAIVYLQAGSLSNLHAVKTMYAIYFSQSRVHNFYSDLSSNTLTYIEANTFADLGSLISLFAFSLIYMTW